MPPLTKKGPILSGVAPLVSRAPAIHSVSVTFYGVTRYSACMPKLKDTSHLFSRTRREEDLVKKNRQLQSMVNVLIRDKYTLEGQYEKLQESFNLLAMVKVQQLADWITKPEEIE